MKFYTYLFLSLLSGLCLIYYAFYTREQFYPAVLFLVSSKVSILIASNTVLCLILLLSRLMSKVFFGAVRSAEVEMLIDNLKYEIMDVFFSVTMFRNEINPMVVFCFSGIIFIKCFHWLAKSRIDYLEQVMPASTWTHIRLQALLVGLCSIDIALCVLCAQNVLKNGKSVILLFGFELGFLAIFSIQITAKYYLHLADCRLTNGLTNKGLFIMLVDLVCDALKAISYLVFFALVFVYYGLPIYIIR